MVWLLVNAEPWMLVRIEPWRRIRDSRTRWWSQQYYRKITQLNQTTRMVIILMKRRGTKNSPKCSWTGSDMSVSVDTGLCLHIIYVKVLSLADLDWLNENFILDYKRCNQKSPGTKTYCIKCNIFLVGASWGNLWRYHRGYQEVIDL